MTSFNSVSRKAISWKITNIHYFLTQKITIQRAIVRLKKETFSLAFSRQYG